MNRYISDTRLRTAALATVVALLTVSTAGPATAQPPVPMRLSTRTLAMGGAGLLSSNPVEMIYFNPGALTLNKGLHLYVPMIQLNFNNPVIDMVKFVDDNKEDFSNFRSLSVLEQAQFVSKINRELGDNWLKPSLDPMIGLQVGSLGFTVYSVSQAALRVTTVPKFGLPEYPVIQLYAENNLVLNGGLGFQFGPLLHGGVGVRYLYRLAPSDTVEVDPGNIDNMSGLMSEIIGSTDESVSGLAVDVGGTVTLTKALAVGGVIRGLISSMKDAEWEPEISAGVRFKPLEVLLGIPLVFIRDITLEADIQDLTNVRGEEYLDKLKLGAEVKLPFIALRAGMNEGRLSYGAGFHLLILDVAVAKALVPVLTQEGIQEESLFSLSVGIGF